MTEPTPPTFDAQGRLLDASGSWAWDENAHDWVTPAAALETDAPADGTPAAPAAGTDDPGAPVPADTDASAPALDPLPVADPVVDAPPLVLNPPVDTSPTAVIDTGVTPGVDPTPAPVPDPEPVPSSTVIAAPQPVVVPDPVVVEPEPTPPAPEDALESGDFVEYAVHWPAESIQRGIVVKVRESDGAASVAWLDAISGPIPPADLAKVE